MPFFSTHPSDGFLRDGLGLQTRIFTVSYEVVLFTCDENSGIEKENPSLGARTESCVCPHLLNLIFPK